MMDKLINLRDVMGEINLDGISVDPLPQPTVSKQVRIFKCNAMT